jgi:hypothetical protein
VLGLGAVEGWVVTHDGETIKTGFKSDFEAVNWLHKRHSFSVDHAVKHEGYDIVLIENGKVTYSYKQDAKKRNSLGARRIEEGSEGTAYIELVPGSHGWYQIRWWSEDERRYYVLAKRPSKEEAIAYARGKGFKVVDMEKPALGAVNTHQKHPIPLWPQFVDAYLEAALWASSTEDGTPLDANYTVEDFTQEAIDQAVQESNDFIRHNRRDLHMASRNNAQHGYDFFLTRNLHGAGFLDRGYGKTGERLAEAARKFGPANAYAGRDGKVRF